MAYDPFVHSAQLEGNIEEPPVVFFEDFVDGWGAEANDTDNTGKFSETADLGQWLVTVVDGGTANAEVIKVSDAEPGGVLTITTNTSDNDSVELQMNGEAWKPAVDKPILFQCRMKLTAAAAPTTTIDWFVGLAQTDTTVLGGTTERIGFSSNGLNAGTADIYSILEDNSTETLTDTAVDYSDNTFFTLSFLAKQTSSTAGEVKYYVNGAYIHTQTTNFPASDDMTLTLAIQNNAAAAKTMEIDYLYLRQSR